MQVLLTHHGYGVPTLIEERPPLDWIRNDCATQNGKRCLMDVTYLSVAETYLYLIKEDALARPGKTVRAFNYQNQFVAAVNEKTDKTPTVYYYLVAHLLPSSLQTKTLKMIESAGLKPVFRQRLSPDVVAYEVYRSDRIFPWWEEPTSTAE